ncbi:MAG: hypothetical protein Q9213_005487 [Squamulea squamosa]
MLVLGTQVEPIHRLRQSAPEHEGVGVKGLVVVLAAEEMLKEVTTGDVELVWLVVAVQLVPMQTLKHNGPEQDGVSVLAVAMPDVMELDPKDVVVSDVANGDVVGAGLDVHVDPTQRLKQSAPEQEDVVVPKLPMLDVMELDPADVIVGNVAVGDVTVVRLDVQVGPVHMPWHRAPEQEVLERADDVVDVVATGTVDELLLVKLLIILPGIVGLVTVLDVVDEHPGPIQIETHNAPLQDVVKEYDELAALDVIDVEAGGSVIRVLGPVVVLLVVEVGHPEPTQRDTHKAPLQEVLVDWKELVPVNTVVSEKLPGVAVD